MTWRDRYQTGTFRGAPFLTEAHDLEGGRRVAVHEYPLRDLPFPEDLGRAGRAFTLEVFVLGAEYMAARDRLLEALEAEGPGTLVHPWLGTLQVQVLQYRVRESTAEGGIARFSLRLVDAGENRFPAGATDSRATVRARADSARTASQAAFVRGFGTAGQPQWVAAGAAGIVEQLLGQLGSLAAPAPAGAGKTGFLAGLTDATSDLDGLVRAPASLADVLSGLVSLCGSLFPSPQGALRGFRGLHGFGQSLPAVPTPTPSRRRQASNQAALVGLARQLAAIEASRTAAGMPFESFDEATAVRDELAGELESHMLTADDPLYPELQGLRAAVIRDVTTRGADLARVVRYTPTTTLPALVVAHRLYGDAAAESAVVTRNRSIRHPGFVTGGRAIEVLTDAA